MLEKKNYNLIDILKFVFAILIMFAHTASSFVEFPNYVDIFFSLYIFGVPFFFACSSFFFFKGLFIDNRIIDENNKKYKNFSRRILLMYGAWSIIYFLFVAMEWIVKGVEVHEVIGYFHKSFIFSTYATIWFLPALWIGVTITYFLLKKYHIKTVLISAVCLYLIGSLMYSYLPVFQPFTILNKWVESYLTVFITSRNGIFNGFPLVAVGALVACNSQRVKVNNWLWIILFFGVIAETFFIKFFIKGFGVDFALLLIPFTYYFLKRMLQIDLPNHPIYIKARNYSMLIFLSQRIFITAIPALLSVEVINKLTRNPYLGLLYVCLSVFIVSYLIIKYRSRFKWLQLLS